MEKETLEEAAERNHNEQKLNTYTPYSFNDAFKDGAKWQSERMYSEDEVDELVNNLISKFLNYNGSSVDNEKLKWFYQQIKKK
jgi:hypothetical protein